MTSASSRAGPPQPEELSDAAVVSRSWGMAFATLISRITGFIRIVLLAAILGAALSSAFTVANQLPNLVAALVLEATFTAIFVPVLARAERDDPDGGTAFVRRLVTLATALLLVATVLSVVAAPLLVHLMLGQDPQVNQPLTTAFAYLLLPQVIFYGLSSVFMAILNTRNVFGPPAWAPVINNVVAIATLLVYLAVPGELSVDPVEMGNAKLLVLGIGTTLGVFAQAAVLLVAIRRERVSLRPLWGLDDRLKKFGAMAAAMVLYVLISQAGLIVGNQIASTAAASGPAIYNYTWLVLMLPFGMIGVTVLTVVMPRLSRNAAADDTPAVLADLALATRLTMITLIPIVAFMTVGGPAIGSALFAYGNFGEVDAGYLGVAITLSAFTLIPYALVLLQLRVFYARQQPWTPIALIVVITVVKIIASLAAPYLTDDRELVAGYLGLANGLGFLAGATVGYLVLRSALKPPGGRLIDLSVIRTILVTIAGSLIAGLAAYVVDRLLGLETWTERFGGGGSLLRLLVLGLIMLPIVAAVLWAAKVPDAHAAVDAVRRRFGRGAGSHSVTAQPMGVSDRPPGLPPLPYADDITRPLYLRPRPEVVRRDPPARVAGASTRRGPAVTDDSAGVPGSGPSSDAGATTRIPRPSADDFQPDVPDEAPYSVADRPPSDFGGDPARETLAFDVPHEVPLDAPPGDEVHLIPGATIAGGRYRLLVFHGGPPHLQFWHAVDITHDRQVALTFVDPEGALPEHEVAEILSRTTKLGRIELPGIARVLDVAQTATGGLIVSEWIRGGSLAEVAETAPSAIGGARAIQSLAAAAEAAHRSGVALSIDHPGRVRVSIDGDVALAFPATLATATPEDDIRGIGAALYALLVNRWPLPEPGVRSGLKPADLDPAGEPLEPRAIDRSIPFQISAASARAVQENGGIRSAPTLLNLLQQATAVADRTELITPVDEPDDSPDRYRHDDGGPETQERKRRGLFIGIAVGGAILVIALVVLATVLSSIFGDVGGPLDKDDLGLNAPTSTTEAADTGVVKPVRAAVFSPGGEADNPDMAAMAIDGNPATAWPTDTYSDPVPFPGFKDGVGLILQLPQPTTVASVTLELNSTGTSIQLRSAPSATPSSLADTTELTSPTAMKTGSNTITVDNAEPTQYLVVWITTLGTVDGKSETALSDITIKSS